MVRGVTQGCTVRGATCIRLGVAVSACPSVIPYQRDGARCFPGTCIDFPAGVPISLAACLLVGLVKLSFPWQCRASMPVLPVTAGQDEQQTLRLANRPPPPPPGSPLDFGRSAGMVGEARVELVGVWWESTSWRVVMVIVVGGPRVDGEQQQAVAGAAGWRVLAGPGLERQGGSDWTRAWCRHCRCG